MGQAHAHSVELILILHCSASHWQRRGQRAAKLQAAVTDVAQMVVAVKRLFHYLLALPGQGLQATQLYGYLLPPLRGIPSHYLAPMHTLH